MYFKSVDCSLVMENCDSQILYGEVFPKCTSFTSKLEFLNSVQLWCDQITTNLQSSRINLDFNRLSSVDDQMFQCGIGNILKHKCCVASVIAKILYDNRQCLLYKQHKHESCNDLIELFGSMTIADK